MNYPTSTDFFEFARYYVWVCEQAGEAQLLQALDGLAFSYHLLPHRTEFDQGGEYERAADYADLRSGFCTRFDGLGFYAAVDDLIDIYATMLEALWIFSQKGQDEAIGFVHLFRRHWLADHLRPLTVHLEQRQPYMPSQAG